MLEKIKSAILGLVAKLPTFYLSSVIIGIIGGYIGHPVIKLALSLIVGVLKLIKLL